MFARADEGNVRAQRRGRRALVGDAALDVRLAVCPHGPAVARGRRGLELRRDREPGPLRRRDEVATAMQSRAVVSAEVGADVPLGLGVGVSGRRVQGQPALRR